MHAAPIWDTLYFIEIINYQRKNKFQLKKINYLEIKMKRIFFN